MTTHCGAEREGNYCNACGTKLADFELSLIGLLEHVKGSASMRVKDATRPHTTERGQDCADAEAKKWSAWAVALEELMGKESR